MLWNKFVPENIKNDYVGLKILFIPLSGYTAERQVLASSSRSARLVAQTTQHQTTHLLVTRMATINTAFKLHIENMPEEINTFKDIDEYYKQFKKEYKEKAKEAKAAAKAEKADKPKRKKGFDKDGNPKEKRLPSKYNIFVKEKYAEIKEAHPDMDKTEIFSEIARIWKEIKNEAEKIDEEEIQQVEEQIISDDEKPKKKRGRKPKTQVVAEETSN